MPAQVHPHPDSTSRAMHQHGQCHSNSKYPDQDPRYGPNYKSEALRLALGTILSPKRPPFTNSRSSSGTASPAYGYSFPPAPHSPGSVPSSGSPQTPANEAHYTDYLLTKVGHPHTPSKLARGSSADDLHVSASADSSSSSPTSPHSTPPHNQNKPEDPVSPLPESAMGSPAHPSPPPDQKESKPSSGTGTPRATFIQTLEGKNHWDALIHGSFS